MNVDRLLAAKAKVNVAECRRMAEGMYEFPIKPPQDFSGLGTIVVVPRGYSGEATWEGPTEAVECVKVSVRRTHVVDERGVQVKVVDRLEDPPSFVVAAIPTDALRRELAIERAVAAGLVVPGEDGRNVVVGGLDAASSALWLPPGVG